MKEEIITVGIADDHGLFREGIISLMEAYDTIKFTLEAENGHELLEKLTHTIPNVLLLDLEMQAIDGIEILKHLKEESTFEEMKVIVLNMFKEPQIIPLLRELGANGYMTKDAAPSELELAIQTVCKEDFYCNVSESHATQLGLKDKTKQPTKPGDAYQITTRELQVLQLLVEGLTTEEISKKLRVTERTVDGHRRSLIRKLDVRDTSALLLKAAKEGLISEG